MDDVVSDVHSADNDYNVVDSQLIFYTDDHFGLYACCYWHRLKVVASDVQYDVFVAVVVDVVDVVYDAVD